MPFARTLSKLDQVMKNGYLQRFDDSESELAHDLDKEHPFSHTLNFFQLLRIFHAFKLRLAEVPHKSFPHVYRRRFRPAPRPRLCGQLSE